MILIRQFFVSIFCFTAVAAQVDLPERKVSGNVITSEHDPNVRIQLPKSVRYVGADRWVLYDIADCELHVFVQADEQRNIHQLYWVQFEAYLPTKPQLKHTYDSPRHASLGGMDFFVDTWVRPDNAEERKGSDLEHLRALVRSKGLHMPAGMMYVRLVHLLDEQKRKELMIIYAEDISPTGFTASELQKGGSAYGRWEAIQERLIQMAKEKITLKENLE